VPLDGKMEESWARYLLGAESEWLKGSVLLSTSDAGVLLLNERRSDLEGKFILDVSNPEAQHRLVYKLSTYEEARKADVPTPKWWAASTLQQIAAIRNELVYPLIVKPLLSHFFMQAFNNAKYLRVENYGELEAAFQKVQDRGLECMLVEYLPGGDDLLCSYTTYIDAEGEPTIDFTKRIVRRYPTGMGLGCCHVTDHNPEVRDLGRKLFRSAGIRGMANAEFKRDPRDGQLKLIECNARFTAATHITVAAGIDLGLYVYNRLTGGPPVPVNQYRDGLMLWDPYRDFLSFRERRARKQLTFLNWIKSIRMPLVLPVFAWDDPGPTWDFLRSGFRGVPRKILRHLRFRNRTAQIALSGGSR
jgi:predicted ATP-grasp superfamily ATP-dependent carboligase